MDMRELCRSGKRYACLAGRGRCGKLSNAECVAWTRVSFGKVTMIGVDGESGFMLVTTEMSLNER